MKKLFVVLSLAGLVALASCGGRGTNEADLYSSAGIASTDRVNYEALRQSVLTPSCLGCHGAGSEYDLTSEASIAGFLTPGKPDQSSLYTEVRDGEMPKGGPKLSEARIALVKRYIEDLAPAAGQNAPTPVASPSGGPGTQPSPQPSSQPSPQPIPLPGGGPSPDVSPTPTVVTYAQIRSELIEASCLKCHGAGSPRGDFSTYELARQEAPDMLERMEIPAAARGTMPPNRPGNVRPSDEARARFKAWIDGGFAQ